MDTGSDLIQPEFLNILFFQQKNLVIFPYIDLKHLHSLELFTAGFNIVDLESTALYNLKEIIEFEANNSYSQNPSLYLIYNLDRDKIQEIMQIKDIRCILNASGRIEDLANGEQFVFYNKKKKKFINYTPSGTSLDFEKELIATCKNEAMLRDKIQEIKTKSTRIFTEINEKGNLDNLPEILRDYNPKYWNKILDFVRLYYKINVPSVDTEKFSQKNQKSKKQSVNTRSEDLSKEYEVIVSLNKNIGKEFVQLLHDYRSQNVNPSNLEIEQLYNPQKLYNYLRNHHWKERIPNDFLFNWVQMINTQYQLKDEDINDFETIFIKLNISEDLILSLITEELNRNEKRENNLLIKKSNHKKTSKFDDSSINQIPSTKDFSKFKKWLLKRIEDIEKTIGLIN